MLSHLAVSGNVLGGSTSSDVSAVHNYDLKIKTYSFLEVSIGVIQEHPLGLAGNVGDMSATCRRHCKMSPIFVPTGQIWRHGF